MAKWDRTTRQAWEKSVVAQEFEKYILEAAIKLQMLSQAGVNQKAEEVEQSMGEAEESLDSLLDAAGETQLADDQSSEEISEEEHKEAQALMISELKKIGEAAVDLGNIKLAYRIERTIAEISGE
tara:strand:+ start:1497 stop:1871 length:375 start_codon:yes stop_codon:yes gene_type:complete